MRPKHSNFAARLACGLALGLAALAARPLTAHAADQDTVTVQITSLQESALAQTKQMAALWCINQRLMLIESRSTMNLSVRLGDQDITFHSNGTKRMHVAAQEQDYDISGQGVVTVRARDQRGHESRAQITCTYTGDGTLSLHEADAGKTISLALQQVSSEVVSMDMQTGEGEVRATLRLQ